MDDFQCTCSTSKKSLNNCFLTQPNIISIHLSSLVITIHSLYAVFINTLIHYMTHPSATRNIKRCIIISNWEIHVTKNTIWYHQYQLQLQQRRTMPPNWSRQCVYTHHSLHGMIIIHVLLYIKDTLQRMLWWLLAGISFNIKQTSVSLHTKMLHARLVDWQIGWT